jgi:hypothetical protein
MNVIPTVIAISIFIIIPWVYHRRVGHSIASTISGYIIQASRDPVLHRGA